MGKVAERAHIETCKQHWSYTMIDAISLPDTSKEARTTQWCQLLATHDVHNLLIVQNNVGKPNMLGRHVEMINASVFWSCPRQFPVGPFLCRRKHWSHMHFRDNSSVTIYVMTNLLSGFRSSRLCETDTRWWRDERWNARKKKIRSVHTLLTEAIFYLTTVWVKQINNFAFLDCHKLIGCLYFFFLVYVAISSSLIWTTLYFL